MTPYRLTDETKFHDGHTLYRIELTADCKWGRAGTKGGWIENRDNLQGNAWVADEAMVYGSAQVYDQARVWGQALVCGYAFVYGQARVWGQAWVYGQAQVYGDARVYGDAQVSDDAQVYEDAILTDGNYTIQHINGGEWNKVPLTIVGSKHIINISSPGIVRVGCYHKPIGEWLNEYEGIGKVEGYSEAEIAEYKSHLDYFNQMMK